MQNRHIVQYIWRIDTQLIINNLRIMDYKRIHSNGNPFSWQENKAAASVQVDAKQQQKKLQALMPMLLSIFK